jgi:hypothetical protein
MSGGQWERGTLGDTTEKHEIPPRDPEMHQVVIMISMFCAFWEWTGAQKNKADLNCPDN